MLNLRKIVKPWREAGALSAHLNPYGFWDSTTTLNKDGSLTAILKLTGVDYESLDSAQQSAAVKRLQSALKVFGKGFHVYQYLLKANRPDIPFARYGDPVVDAMLDQREWFFAERRDHLYSIEIFYAVVLEAPRQKVGWKAWLSSSKTKVLLRQQVEASRQQLHQQIESFRRQVADVTPTELLDSAAQLTFFRRLINFDDWRIAGRPSSSQFLDYQIARSDVEAERDHLRVGDHYVRLLTMKDAISETRPLVLDRLLKIPANFYAVTEWTPVTPAEARRRVNMKRGHANLSKRGLIQTMRAEKTEQRDQLVDESKQADVEQLGDCLRALGEGQTLGDLSLTVVLYGRNLDAVQHSVAEFSGIFTNADGALHAETYNQLNALFAAVPGGSAHNLRSLAFLNSNYADLSFLFTILPGQVYNPHLNSDYLAVLETDNATPYYLNLHNGEVAHTLITGMTGSGKSFLAAFILASAQKYRPQTYIFDIGGSFESLTEIFGGTYLNAGRESRDFTINPFSLDPSEANRQFLFAFLRVLIEGNDARFRLNYEEERKLWDAIDRIYLVPVDQRTLSTFASISGSLQPRLVRWTRAGQFGFLFDNVEDTLTFSRFQAFNFAGWGDAPDALDPLLFYVLHRSAIRITDPDELATFKAFFMDEAWLFLKNPTIREYVIAAQKTWRKHNAAMILATQSIKELQDSGMLEVVAESCPTKIFLANPEMDPKVYGEAFHLNDTELALIADLVPPGEMLIRRSDSSKKVRLEVDAVTYWIATNNARDNLRKREYFARYGIADGIRRLAEDFPPHHKEHPCTAASLSR